MLRRAVDVTGVSGTGLVAGGQRFPDGHVALRWLVGEHRSTVAWDSIEAVQAIHGHDGATEVVMLDGPDAHPDAPAILAELGLAPAGT